MFKKMAIIGALGVLLALLAPMSVLANRPPPNPFGGGERAIHINENASTTGQNGLQHTHTDMALQGYEYRTSLGTLKV